MVCAVTELVSKDDEPAMLPTTQAKTTKVVTSRDDFIKDLLSISKETVRTGRRGRIEDQYGSATTSPPLRVPKALHVGVEIDEEIRRTEPSAMAAFTTPG